MCLGLPGTDPSLCRAHPMPRSWPGLRHAEQQNEVERGERRVPITEHGARAPRGRPASWSRVMNEAARWTAQTSMP